MTVVSIGTTSDEIVDSDGRRISLLIANPSLQNVWVGSKSHVAVDSGILLTGKGGSMSLTLIEDGDLVQSQWYAISESGTVSLWVEEGYTLAS